MKISNIQSLVTFSLIASSLSVLTGCGGSGVSTGQTSFKHGLFVPTYNFHSVRYVSSEGDNSTTDVVLNDGSKPITSAVDESGKLYIGTFGGKIICVPSPGSAERIELQMPAGETIDQAHNLVADGSGHLYINDYGHKRIIRVDDMTGAGWTTMNYLPYLVSGVDDNTSLALDSSHRIYIASRIGSRIMRFNDMSDMEPTWFGSPGSGFNQFNDVTDLSIDGSGHIFAADRNNNRIVKIDNMNGDGWVSVGAVGSGVKQFNNPDCISVDQSGNIFVADALNGRLIRMSDMTGAGWTTVATIGNGQGQLPSLADILAR